MKIKQRIIAWIFSALALMAYAPSLFAASPVSWNDKQFDEWVIETPVSMRGRFIFVQRESRRLLRQRVLAEQTPYRPFLVERDRI